MRRINIHELNLDLQLGLTEETHKYIKRLFNHTESVDILNIKGDILVVSDIVSELQTMAEDRSVILRNINITASCN